MGFGTAAAAGGPSETSLACGPGRTEESFRSGGNRGALVDSCARGRGAGVSSEGGRAESGVVIAVGQGGESGLSATGERGGSGTGHLATLGAGGDTFSTADGSDAGGGSILG